MYHYGICPSDRKSNALTSDYRASTTIKKKKISTIGLLIGDMNFLKAWFIILGFHYDKMTLLTITRF